MIEDGARRQPAERAERMRPELAEERTRPAWAKPVLYRFSLQRTLAGSGLTGDVARSSSATAT